MKSSTKRSLAFLWTAVKPYKRRAAGFFVVTFLGVMGWTASPYAIRTIVNRLAHDGTVDSTIWWLTALFIALRLTDEILWRIGDALVRSIKPRMVEGVRTRLFTETLRKPYLYFVNASSGRVGHWINQTTNTVNEISDTTTWSVWGRMIGMVLAAVFLAVAQWKLALLFVVWLVALFWYTVKRGRTLSRLVEKQSDETSIASGMVVDALSNHMSVRVFNARERETQLLRAQQEKVVRRWGEAWLFSLKTNIVKGQSAALVNGLALIAVLLMFMHGEAQLGDILLFVTYFTDASNSLWELAWSFDNYYRSFATLENALEGLSGTDERMHEVAPGTVRIPQKAGIELKNLTFTYPDQAQNPVLKHVNLNVNPGERIGVVGHSGAGKSTLVSLLLGFYEVEPGMLLLGGKASNDLRPDEMRAMIAFVPQDTNLFNRTIKENIAYARLGATDEEIYQAARDAQAIDFIEQLPQGFDTIIGERGVKLSGGQRQRIAIARALLKDAPILLLDEATSALDSVSEHAIQKAFLAAMKNRTALVVAHRLSTLRHLDRIVVFDKGTIVEQGTQDELVKLNGLYADLWRRQKDGFIAE